MRFHKNVKKKLNFYDYVSLIAPLHEGSDLWLEIVIAEIFNSIRCGIIRQAYLPSTHIKERLRMAQYIARKLATAYSRCNRVNERQSIRFSPSLLGLVTQSKGEENPPLRNSEQCYRTTLISAARQVAWKFMRSHLNMDFLKVFTNLIQRARTAHKITLTRRLGHKVASKCSLPLVTLYRPRSKNFRHALYPCSTDSTLSMPRKDRPSGLYEDEWRDVLRMVGIRLKELNYEVHHLCRKPMAYWKRVMQERHLAIKDAFVDLEKRRKAWRRKQVKKIKARESESEIIAFRQSSGCQNWEWGKRGMIGDSGWANDTYPEFSSSQSRAMDGPEDNKKHQATRGECPSNSGLSAARNKSPNNVLSATHSVSRNNNMRKATKDVYRNNGFLKANINSHARLRDVSSNIQNWSTDWFSGLRDAMGGCTTRWSGNSHDMKSPEEKKLKDPGGDYRRNPDSLASRGGERNKRSSTSPAGVDPTSRHRRASSNKTKSRFNSEQPLKDIESYIGISSTEENIKAALKESQCRRKTCNEIKASLESVKAETDTLLGKERSAHPTAGESYARTNFSAAGRRSDSNSSARFRRKTSSSSPEDDVARNCEGKRRQKQPQPTTHDPGPVGVVLQSPRRSSSVAGDRSGLKEDEGRKVKSLTEERGKDTDLRRVIMQRLQDRRRSFHELRERRRSSYRQIVARAQAMARESQSYSIRQCNNWNWKLRKIFSMARGTCWSSNGLSRFIGSYSRLVFRGVVSRNNNTLQTFRSGFRDVKSPLRFINGSNLQAFRVASRNNNSLMKIWGAGWFSNLQLQSAEQDAVGGCVESPFSAAPPRPHTPRPLQTRPSGRRPSSEHPNASDPDRASSGPGHLESSERWTWESHDRKTRGVRKFKKPDEENPRNPEKKTSEGKLDVRYNILPGEGQKSSPGSTSRTATDRGSKYYTSRLTKVFLQQLAEHLESYSRGKGSPSEDIKSALKTHISQQRKYRQIMASLETGVTPMVDTVHGEGRSTSAAARKSYQLSSSAGHCSDSSNSALSKLPNSNSISETGAAHRHDARKPTKKSPQPTSHAVAPTRQIHAPGGTTGSRGLTPAAAIAVAPRRPPTTHTAGLPTHTPRKQSVVARLVQRQDKLTPLTNLIQAQRRQSQPASVKTQQQQQQEKHKDNPDLSLKPMLTPDAACQGEGSGASLVESSPSFSSSHRTVTRSRSWSQSSQSSRGGSPDSASGRSSKGSSWVRLTPDEALLKNRGFAIYYVDRYRQQAARTGAGVGNKKLSRSLSRSQSWSESSSLRPQSSSSSLSSEAMHSLNYNTDDEHSDIGARAVVRTRGSSCLLLGLGSGSKGSLSTSASQPPGPDHDARQLQKPSLEAMYSAQVLVQRICSSIDDLVEELVEANLGKDASVLKPAGKQGHCKLAHDDSEGRSRRTPVISDKRRKSADANMQTHSNNQIFWTYAEQKPDPIPTEVFLLQSKSRKKRAYPQCKDGAAKYRDEKDNTVRKLSLPKKSFTDENMDGKQPAQRGQKKAEGIATRRHSSPDPPQSGEKRLKRKDSVKNGPEDIMKRPSSGDRMKRQNEGMSKRPSQDIPSGQHSELETRRISLSSDKADSSSSRVQKKEAGPVSRGKTLNRSDRVKKQNQDTSERPSSNVEQERQDIAPRRHSWSAGCERHQSESGQLKKSKGKVSPCLHEKTAEGRQRTEKAGLHHTKTVKKAEGYQGTRKESHQGTKIEGQQGTKTESHQGTKAKGHQGTKADGHQGTSKESHQGTKAEIHQGTKAEIHQGTKADVHQGTKADGYQSTKAEGHQGTKTEGHHGTKAAGQQYTKKAESSQTAMARARVTKPSIGTLLSQQSSGSALSLSRETERAGSSDRVKLQTHSAAVTRSHSWTGSQPLPSCLSLVSSPKTSSSAEVSHDVYKRVVIRSQSCLVLADRNINKGSVTEASGDVHQEQQHNDNVDGSSSAESTLSQGFTVSAEPAIALSRLSTDGDARPTPAVFRSSQSAAKAPKSPTRHPIEAQQLTYVTLPSSLCTAQQDPAKECLRTMALTSATGTGTESVSGFGRRVSVRQDAGAASGPQRERGAKPSDTDNQQGEKSRVKNSGTILDTPETSCQLLLQAIGAAVEEMLYEQRQDKEQASVVAAAHHVTGNKKIMASLLQVVNHTLAAHMTARRRHR